MTPKDPVVEVGTTLVLNCSLDNVTSDYNSSGLYFQLGNTRIPDKYVSRLTPAIAQLRLPNITKDKKGHYYCYHHDVDKLFGQQVVSIGSMFIS